MGDFGGDEVDLFNDKNSHQFFPSEKSTSNELLASINEWSSDERKFEKLFAYRGIAPSSAECQKIVEAICADNVKLRTIKYMISQYLLDVSDAIKSVQTMRICGTIVEAIKEIAGFYYLMPEHCVTLLRHVKIDEFRVEALDHLASRLSSPHIPAVIDIFQSPRFRKEVLQRLSSKVRDDDFYLILSLFPLNHHPEISGILRSAKVIPELKVSKMPDLDSDSSDDDSEHEPSRGPAFVVSKAQYPSEEKKIVFTRAPKVKISAEPDELTVVVARSNNDVDRLAAVLRCHNSLPAKKVSTIIVSFDGDKYKSDALKHLVVICDLNATELLPILRTIKMDYCILEVIQAKKDLYISSQMALKLISLLSEDHWKENFVSMFHTKIGYKEIVATIQVIKSQHSRMLALRYLMGRVIARDLPEILNLLEDPYKEQARKLYNEKHPQLVRVPHPIKMEYEKSMVHDHPLGLLCDDHQPHPKSMGVIPRPSLYEQGMFPKVEEIKEVKQPCNAWGSDGKAEKTKEVKPIEYPETGVDIEAGENDEKNICVVCLENKQTTICIPCAHICLCFKCSKDIALSGKGCPYCREPLMSIKIFRIV